MSGDFLEVDPDTVTAAGHRTAASSGQWSAWAVQVESHLRDAAGAAREGAVAAAIESYLTGWNPRLHRLAANAEALGANAASAAHVVANVDTVSAGDLAQRATATYAAGTVLSRPIAAE